MYSVESIEFELAVFGIGFGIGLLLTIFMWFSNLKTRSSMRQEVADLKKHLQTNLSIQAKGYDEVRQELEKLKKENENLRITVATLSNKPGRAELKMLHTWDKAIRGLTLKSPAFAPAWEMAVSEAKREIEDTDSGVKALVRKVFSLLQQDNEATNSEATNSQ